MGEKQHKLDPKELLISVQGRDYLPVAARIALFRELYPIDDGWAIVTEPVELPGLPPNTVAFRASVLDGEGNVVSSAIKTASTGGKFPAQEKAETGAIGRAIGAAGIGTIYAAQDFEEDDELADSPVQTSKAASKGAATKPATGGKGPAQKSAPMSSVCARCGGEVVPGRVAWCSTNGVPVTHRLETECNATRTEAPGGPVDEEETV